MQAVVYDEPGRFTVRAVPDPIAGPGEVLIRVIQTGLCGTDVHVDQGEYAVTYPLTPGHEVVGLVEALGDGVQGLALGAQVTVNPNAACGTCGYCQGGRRIMCGDMRSVGVTRPGGFAELVVAPAEDVFALPGVDPDVAVFTEPASCAMHGLETVQCRPGSAALVFGAGPTGVLLAQLLAHGGAAHVTVADSSDFKLDRARSFGIDATVLVDRADPGPSDAQLRAIAPDGFDIVVEATGSPVVAERCVPLTRSGGTVMIYGVAAPDAQVRFHPYEVFRREITIKGSFAEIESFPGAIRAITNGRVRTDGLITHRYALADYGLALDALRHDPSVHKVVMHP